MLENNDKEMLSGTVVAVCLSHRRGIPKSPQASVHLKEDLGIEGDAHAGPGERQVSLLAAESIGLMRAKGLELSHGAFGENIVTDGIDLAALTPGDILRCGLAELEVTRIGKVCHSRCAIYYSAGDCIMPREGVFARVTRGGELSPGQSINVIRGAGRPAVQATGKD